MSDSKFIRNRLTGEYVASWKISGGLGSQVKWCPSVLDAAKMSAHVAHDIRAAIINTPDSRLNAAKDQNIMIIDEDSVQQQEAPTVPVSPASEYVVKHPTEGYYINHAVVNDGKVWTTNWSFHPEAATRMDALSAAALVKASGQPSWEVMERSEALRINGLKIFPFRPSGAAPVTTRKRYEVLTSPYVEELEKLVTEALGKGALLVGGLAVRVLSDRKPGPGSPGQVYLQPVVWTEATPSKEES